MVERREDEAECSKRSRTTTTTTPDSSSSLRRPDRTGQMDVVQLFCACRNFAEEFDQPCTACHCRKRSRFHLLSLPSKKILCPSTTTSASAADPSLEASLEFCTCSCEPSSSRGPRSPESGSIVKNDGCFENAANVPAAPSDISETNSSVYNPTPEAAALIKDSNTDNLGASVACGGFFTCQAAACSFNNMSTNGKNGCGFNVSPNSPLPELSKSIPSGLSLTTENKDAANADGQSHFSDISMPERPSEDQFMEEDKKNSVTVLSGDNVTVTRDGDIVKFCFKCPCGIISEANYSYKWS